MGLAAEQALAKGVADDGNVAAVFILLGGESRPRSGGVAKTSK